MPLGQLGAPPGFAGNAADRDTHGRRMSDVTVGLPLRRRASRPKGRGTLVPVFEALSFRVGSSHRARVIVQPTRRENPEAMDADDGNWIYATIDIAAGAFRGSFEANLRAEDFERFRDELRPLYERLDGSATFDTMEGWLRIAVQGDGKGHFHAACEAIDRPGLGNRLTFAIDFDQTELPAMVRAVEAICDAVPVVGAPRGTG